VRLLCGDRTCAAGTQSLLWDGRGDAGLRAPDGAYLVEVTVYDAAGGVARATAPLTLRR
jgi:flagellar hook assembly protein FlgD